MVECLLGSGDPLRIVGCGHTHRGQSTRAPKYGPLPGGQAHQRKSTQRRTVMNLPSTRTMDYPSSA